MPVAVDIGQRLFVYSPHRSWTVAYFVKVIVKDTNLQIVTCRLARCPHSPTFGEHIRYSPHNVAIADRITDQQLNVGSRILCIPSNSLNTDVSCKQIEKPQRGMIAELATESNSNRFLIFADIGEPYYIQCNSIRLLLESLSNYLLKVDQGTKQFIENYVLTYPKRRLIDVGVKSRITIEYNGQWLEGIVSKCNCTLIRVYIPSLNKQEWLYRGSLRLQPLFNSLTTNVTTYDDEPTSKRLAIDLQQHQEHRCTNACEKSLPLARKCNFLMIPLNYGWRRQVRNDLGTIVYISPCGQAFTDRERLHLYLRQINSCLTMNLFSFEMDCRATQKYNLINPPIIDIADYSNNLELLPLSLVNEINNELPTKFDYICTRVPSRDEIPINELKDSIQGCTCTDGCSETHKCLCWQRTYDSIIKSYYYEDLITNLKELFKTNRIIDDTDKDEEENMKLFLYKQLSKQNLGYKHGRLLEKIHSGIYECNEKCKCDYRCTNRCVQFGLNTLLQIYRTHEKGWGVRTLYDLPMGTFLSFYAGEILNDDDANKRGVELNDIYFTALDFVNALHPPQLNKSNMINGGDHVPAASTTTNINMTTPDNEVQHNYIVPSNQSKTYETITTNEKSIDKHDMSQSHPQSHEISDSDIYIMDANLKGNVSRFFNHSCSPNVFVQNVFIETYDVRFPWVAFFTSANVKAGTELCWDYQYEVGSVEDRVLSCQCGATNCRSRLL